MLPSKPASRPAFAIFTTTRCEGLIPAWHDANGLPVTYPTEREAQLEIAETLIEQLHQFIAGDRPFADALHCEDFILPVDVFPDARIRTEAGHIFGRR